MSLYVVIMYNVVCYSETMITGAGATFPYPLYNKWATAYEKIHQVRLNYQPIGSGGGIKQIIAKLVDFGASDKPLKSQDLAKNSLIQFPAVIGAIVPVVNIPGIKAGSLKLSGELLAEIYLGKIQYWDDPRIRNLNPDLPLPKLKITVVHRSDGSGTTFLFSNYLSKISQEWNTEVGSDTSIAWPAGVGGKGNEGVASFVQHIKGGIGYVEYSYTKQSKTLIVTAMINSAGKVVLPNTASFQEAAKNTEMDASNDFSVILTDAPGEGSWPITAATYILMQRIQTQPERALAILQFFSWAFTQGKQMALELDYVPLPENVMTKIKNYWQQNLKDSRGKSILMTSQARNIR